MAQNIKFKPDKIQLPYIQRQGQRVEYEKAMKSSEVDPITGGKKFDFDEGEFTGGADVDIDGYTYEPGVPMKAVLSNIQDTIHFTGPGEVKTGDVYAGFPWQVPLAFHDRITILGRRVEHGAIMVRGTNDQLKDFRVIELLEAYTETQTYIPYKDFALDDDNNVTWLTTGPSVGTQYMVKMIYLPQYLIWQVLSLDRLAEDQRSMQRAVLRHYDPLTKAE